MNPKVEYIFSSIERARITISDFSRITTISRETLYRWKNGATCRDQLRLGMAYTAAQKINVLIANKRLPLTDKLKSPHRANVLRSIIQETKLS